MLGTAQGRGFSALQAPSTCRKFIWVLHWPSASQQLCLHRWILSAPSRTGGDCIISTGVFFLRLMGPIYSSVTDEAGGGKGEKVVESSVGTGSSAGCNSSTGTGSSASSFFESPVVWDTVMFGSLERRLIYSRTMFNVHKKYEYNASEINEYQDHIYISSKKASLSDVRHSDLWQTSQ